MHQMNLQSTEKERLNTSFAINYHVMSLQHYCCQQSPHSETEKNAFSPITMLCIVPASAHPPILTVLGGFEVLCVTAYHPNFLCSELKVGPLSSHT